MLESAKKTFFEVPQWWKIYFVVISNKKLLYFIYLLKDFLFIFLWVRFLFCAFLNCFSLGVLPSEIALLEGYLSREEDPEWVNYVRTELANCPSYEFDTTFRRFLYLEECSITKDQILHFYKIVFFGREAHLSFLQEMELDAICRSALEYIEFDCATLSNILRSLILERHNSFFYETVFITQQHHFQGFYQLYCQEEMERWQSHTLFLQSLEWDERCRFLQQENSSLSQAISRFQPDRESQS